MYYTRGCVCKYTIMGGGGYTVQCVHKNRHFDQSVKIDLVRDGQFWPGRKKAMSVLNQFKYIGFPFTKLLRKEVHIFVLVDLHFCAKNSLRNHSNLISCKIVLFRFCFILFSAILQNKFSKRCKLYKLFIWLCCFSLKLK